ncbi:hypothetical protein AO457_02455 [Oenococcus oeni]|uniref:hypothetical protein n=1 Tax=Oenococcus oeni TaxID=1247 RepID=UPI000BDFA1E9|nr:hypothetical protein [Oenococcus oeni]PDH77213.1 hypothetical protein AO457_02455 [Oenococcus oeni]
MAKKNALAGINTPAATPAAASFISEADTEKRPGRPASKGETKSRRTNILFKPSTYEDLQTLALLKRTSVNELLNQLAEEAVAQNRSDIDRFNKDF